MIITDMENGEASENGEAYQKHTRFTYLLIYLLTYLLTYHIVLPKPLGQ